MPNNIEASKINSIKARVKAEMLRRNQVGSLVSYGGTQYDYTQSETPVRGGISKPVHLNKIITPLNAIRPIAGSPVSSAQNWRSLSVIESALATFESASMTSGSDCATSCSGLCRGQCNTGCSGCSGGCSGCSGCGGRCSNSCSGSCDGDCDGCSGSCEGSCKGGCDGSCGGRCSSGCTGCYGGCSGVCDSGCRGICSSGCTSCVGCKGND